jgi:hypothetical protein
MQFLVRGTLMDPEGPLPKEQIVKMLEYVVATSLAKLMRLEQERKVIGGGIPVGDRGVTFIVEAKDGLEADAILRDLPLSDVTSWNVTPLQPFRARIGNDHKLLELSREPI